MRGSFRTRADSRTGNRAERNGGRKKFKVDFIVKISAFCIIEVKKYKGGRTVDELLQDMAEGKDLSDAELEYVKIFANLKDMEKAQQKAELKTAFQMGS